jgi:short subunit dehydrogenase-like uncharacterized protein
MKDGNWLIYGANGYTGELVAEEAARRGLRPILAARREEAVRPIAEKLGLAFRAFALDDPARVAAGLEGVKLVLHCAGPFSHTSKPMVEACLRAKAHYLDVTGEIAVFEACKRRDADARAAGVVVLPGVGFDVVPSDCLAASLKAALPDAIKLELAFAGLGGVSRGTAKTMVEGLGLRGAVREGGKIKNVPLAYKTRTIAFSDKQRFAMTIPWGDVSTAFHSTGIPDIAVYFAIKPNVARTLKWINPVAPLLGRPLPQRLLKRAIERRAPGPSEHERKTGSTQLWGRVENAAGRAVEGTLVTPDGYAHTVDASLACVERILASSPAPGYHTPSTAFGAAFVKGLPGCELSVGAAA